jgi:uncharacterized protein YgbK (DUF1537 family)
LVLVIIADDLTGALDTAAPFAARGLNTQVVLDLDAVPAVLDGLPDVLSINLASREISAEAARTAMRRVAERLPPGVRLFKKVDSRLKGHVAAELDALSYRAALVAPAIPSFGRVVRDGHVEGFGVDRPISIAEALGSHAVRSWVPDTLTDSDLVRALEQTADDGADLLVGARGLAEALASRMTGKKVASLVAPPAGPALFVIGSHDRITLEQVERLRDLQTLVYRPAPNGVLQDADRQPSPFALVQATPGDIAISPEAVARNLAASVHPTFTQGTGTLLLCGGATAEAVLAQMGIVHFRLEGECLPGLGLAYADGQCIIAKSGGFGGAETLVTLAGHLGWGRG